MQADRSLRHQPSLRPTEPSWPAQRLLLLLGTVLLLACYLYWRFMLRWFFLQRDDFWLVTITERPYGTFDLDDFLFRWWHDWSVRNGRSADAVVRAMLRPGVEAAGWIIPAVLTLSTAATWRWLPRGRSLLDRGLAMTALLGAVPVMLSVVPSISGNTVFWAAGIANYVVATALGVLATSWLLRPPPGRVALWGLAVPSVLAAHLIQEQASVTTLLVAGMWWLLNRGGVDATRRILLATTGLGFTVTVLTPGLWRRFGEVSGGESGVRQWLTSVARFGSELVLQTAPLLLVVLAALTVAVVGTWRSSTPAARRLSVWGTGVGWVAGLATWGQSRSWRSSLAEERCGQISALAGSEVTGAVLLTGLGVVTVLGITVVGLGLRTRLGDAPVLLWTGAIGTLPLSAVVGVCAARVWYPPLVWLLVLVVVLLQTMTVQRLLPRLALAVLAAAAALVAGRFALVAEPALRANHASFQGVLTQIPATQQAGAGEIVFPDDVPYPDYGKTPVYRLPSIACTFRVYYAVPEEVVLDDGTGPRAGRPDYCPRPDALPLGS